MFCPTCADNLQAELSNRLLSYYKENFIKNDFEVIEHKGTWISVGVSDFVFRDEVKLKGWYKFLDTKPGFIIKYGHRMLGTFTHLKTGEKISVAEIEKDPNYDERMHQMLYHDKASYRYEMGKEKGVDAEIICQMLMGAFLDHYDACILVSDDIDYIPAVTRIQDYFGKKVIQAGFHKHKLRESAYAHIPFESAGVNLEKLKR